MQLFPPAGVQVVFLSIFMQQKYFLPAHVIKSVWGILESRCPGFVAFVIRASRRDYVVVKSG